MSSHVSEATISKAIPASDIWLTAMTSKINKRALLATTRKYVSDVTSVGYRSSPLPWNLIKVARPVPLVHNLCSQKCIIKNLSVNIEEGYVWRQILTFNKHGYYEHEFTIL